ncbi:MAG: leucine-rich repeat domain-containing protein [Oscillospiraceae bacterium]|nr:leucine-rich repeat domain-containing protein [Oscillospiraceae bacterium]
MKALKIIIPVIVALAIAAGCAWVFTNYGLTGKVETLADNAAAEGNADKAEKLYSLAFKINDENFSARCSHAMLYADRGDFTHAEALLGQSIQAYPACADYYLALSRVYVMQDKVTDAVRLLDTAENGAAGEDIKALRPEAPQFYPESGIYSYNISATIFCGEGLTVLYGTGEEPPSTGMVFSQPLDIAQEFTAVSAVAINGEGIVSSLTRAEYTLENVITTVEISDPTLEGVLRQALGKGEEDVIWTDELWEIESLTISHGSDSPIGTIEDWSDLRYLEGLRTLVISEQDRVDMEALKLLPKLTELTLSHCSITSQDLPAIGELTNLEYLNLTGNRVASLHDLEGLTKLTRLSLKNNSLADLDRIEALTALQVLDISGNAVEDISPLAETKNLRELYGENLLISDLAPLSGLKKLEKLALSGCAVEDLSPLAAVTTMTHMDLSYNKIEDMSPLAELVNLKYLDLSYNSLLKADELAGFTALEQLKMANNALDVLPDLSELDSLTRVELANNSLTGVAAFTGCEKLEYLDIEYCFVSDISCLSSCGALKTVMAFGTEIEDKGGLDELGVTVYWDLNLT